MSTTHLLRSIFSDVWAIDPNQATALYGRVLSMLKGEEPEKIPFAPTKFNSHAYALTLNELGKVDASEVLDLGALASAEPGSNVVNVGLVSIRDVIVKYDAFCGPRGTLSIASDIESMVNDPRIAAIVISFDSPGGSTNAIEHISKVISDGKAKKPIIAYVGNGMAASAAYWIASNCDEIYTTYEMDSVGSIGTYATIADLKAYYESQGLKIHEIFASKSKDKNLESREALKGEYDLMRSSWVDPINEKFLGTVKANRPGVSEDVLTGKMYMSSDALSKGLIDGVMSFNDVLSRAAELARNKENSSTSNQLESNMKITKDFSAILSFLGLKDGDVLSQENLTKLNAEVAELQNVRTELSNAISERDALKTEKENLTNEISNKDARIADLEKITGQESTAVKTGNDKIVATTEVKSSWELRAEKQPEID